MSVWTSTINALIAVFHDSLVALAPIVERARIAWRDDEAYDDWDAITDVLFEQLVVSSVRWSLPEAAHTTFRMAPYNVLVESYRGFTFVAVTDPRLSAPAAFHSFATVDSAFDTVCVRELNELGEPRNAGVRRLEFGSVQYSLRTLSRTGEVAETERITVRV